MNIQDLCKQWGIPVNKIEGGVGELSDGYHSFNDLYHQRCVLFATICNTFKELAWKSRKYSDGELCFGGGWFIVGIDTPQGQYTYRYEDKDWDLFNVKELEVGKEWDGHTDKDVERLLSLTEADKKVIIGKEYRVKTLKDFKEIEDKIVSGDKVFFEAGVYTDKVYPVVEEEYTKSSWATKEVELACIAETKDSSPEDPLFDYGHSCYKSALKAFNSLCGDDHSGMSIGYTRNILNNLIDGKPLTPIKDTDDVWTDVTGLCVKDELYKMYQCKRMSSLFKYVYTDGSIKYKDVNSISCVDMKSKYGFAYHSSLVQRLMDEMFPIIMPYSPGEPIKVYCEEFLTDHANGDFDTVGIFNAIKDGEKIKIYKFFKEADTETGWVEIHKDEYEGRRFLSEELKKEDIIRVEALNLMNKTIYGINPEL